MTSYKQTELGLIPSDWEVVELGDICTLKSGQTITAKKIHDLPFGYPCYGGNGLRGYTNSYTHDGEFSLIGRQGALCGNIVYVKGKFFASEHALVVTQQDNVNAKWLSIYLEKMNLNQHSESSAQPGLSAEKLKLLNLIFPKSKPEQTAIATALSDTDALLAELEKLLAKKQAIKTATMQQLLTGKTRLPEFAHRADGTPKGSLKTEWGDVPEDWEVVALGDVGYFQAGVGFPLTIQGKKSGKYPFFKVSDLNNIGNETYLQASNNYINEQDKELISAKTIPINSIVFAKIGAAVFLERKRINNQESLIDNNMMAYIPNHKFLYKFAYYCFLRMKLSLLVEVTALPSLSSTELGKTKIFIPKSTTEQTAIAQILGDMDSEITALQARIEKLREIKQGMMQNLLTGKIRLPF